MNERFWQLVEQADDEGGDDPDIRDEVFATLIIQECMAVAAKQRKPANLNYNPSERFMEDLKQHFGIEA